MQAAPKLIRRKVGSWVLVCRLGLEGSSWPVHVHRLWRAVLVPRLPIHPEVELHVCLCYFNDEKVVSKKESRVFFVYFWTGLKH